MKAAQSAGVHVLYGDSSDASAKAAFQRDLETILRNLKNDLTAVRSKWGPSVNLLCCAPVKEFWQNLEQKCEALIRSPTVADSNEACIQIREALLEQLDWHRPSLGGVARMSINPTEEAASTTLTVEAAAAKSTKSTATTASDEAALNAGPSVPTAPSASSSSGAAQEMPEMESSGPSIDENVDPQIVPAVTTSDAAALNAAGTSVPTAPSASSSNSSPAAVEGADPSYLAVVANVFSSGRTMKQA